MKREDSTVLQGIAVLMMILHHFFLDISTYPENFFLFPDFFQRFAWSGRMCVAIFSFVSGYGMYQTLKKKNDFGSMIRDCSKRLFHLYARIFLVIIFCVYVPRLVRGEHLLIAQLPGNIIGYNTTYNGAWWFVLEYLWFMILAPIFAIIVSSRVKMKKHILLVLILGIAGLFGKGIIFYNSTVVNFFEVRMQPTFLFVFAEGFFVGKIQDFVAGMKWSDKIRKYLDRIRCPIVGIAFCLLSLVLRYLYTTEPYKVNADVLLVPVFCCGVALWLKKTSKIKSTLIFIGKNSLYLWFVHNFVYAGLIYFILDWSGYWLVFFLILFVVSLGVAILLEKIEKIIKMRILSNRT